LGYQVHQEKGENNFLKKLTCLNQKFSLNNGIQMWVISHNLVLQEDATIAVPKINPTEPNGNVCPAKLVSV